MNIVYSSGVACSVNDILDRIDIALSKFGEEYLNIVRYDLVKTVKLTDMYLLIIYKKMLLNKLSFCSDCFTDVNRHEISSKILRLIY